MQHDFHVQFDDNATAGGSKGMIQIVFDQEDPQRTEIMSAIADVMQGAGRTREASELLSTGVNRPVGGETLETAEL